VVVGRQNKIENLSTRVGAKVERGIYDVFLSIFYYR